MRAPPATGILLAAACLAACRPAGEAGTAGSAAADGPAPAAPSAEATSGPGAVAPEAAPAAPPWVRDLAVRVVASYPHDPASYTQGLELAAGVLYESAGQYGESSIRRVDLESGVVLLRRDLPPDLFGEGLTLVPAAAGRPARLLQLTWQGGVALARDPATLEPVGEHRYRGEGWGLCFDGGGPEARLVMSDGSAYLTFRDPATFEIAGGVPVTLGGAPLGGLNELECVGGSVWANVYPTRQIVEVDPATGRVTATVDASGLLTAFEAPDAEVLNGIAHDPADGTFLLTGKYWPRLFRVELVER